MCVETYLVLRLTWHIMWDWTGEKLGHGGACIKIELGQHHTVRAHS